MTGPEHYRQAEKLISLLYGDVPAGVRRDLLDAPDAPARRDLLAEAQVHATLALAAATALAARERTGDWDPAGMDPADRLAWDYAAFAAAPVAADRDAWGAQAPSMPYADWLAEGRAPQPAQDAAASTSRTRQGGPAT